MLRTAGLSTFGTAVRRSCRVRLNRDPCGLFRAQAEHRVAQVQRRGVGAPALWADPPPRDVLDHLDRGRRDVQHLAAAHNLAPAQRRAAVGAGVHRVLHGAGGRHAPPPEGLAMHQAGLLECLPGPLMSRDNVRSMRADNVATGAPQPWGREPTSLETIAPGYLGSANKRARFAAWQLRRE